MSKDFLDYESMVQEALRNVMKKALIQISKEGLLGDHHFYITFDTNHPSVVIPDYLKDQYGDELTIVLQYEFWDLEVDENSFSVTLCFDENHENIVVPYTSVISFVDPSVKFGLQFTPLLEDGIEGKTLKSEKKPQGQKTEENKHVSNVVTLDSFRKK